MKKKVVITAILSPEASEMKDKDIEGAIRFYLYPFIEKIERIEVLTED